MQALSDEQRIDILEKKMDEGFARMDQSLAEMRAEMREDFREVRGQIGDCRGQIGGWGRSILAMWLTMILGFAGIIIAMLTHF